MEILNGIAQYGQFGIGAITLGILIFVLKGKEKDRETSRMERQSLTNKLIDLTERNVAAYTQHVEVIRELKEIIKNSNFYNKN